MRMGRYLLHQNQAAVGSLQHIHFGNIQQMLLIESAQDANLNKEDS